MIYSNVQVRNAEAHSSRRSHRRHLRTAMAVALAAPLFGTVAAHAAGPGPTKPKQSYALHIGVDNGHTTVRAGDRLTYITKVNNTGAARTPELLLTQTLVPGLKVISSTPEGTVAGGRISWKKALPTGKTEQLSVTVEVGALSAQLQRLAAVVCASTKTGKRPIVCASDSDMLQTATAAEGQLLDTLLGGLWYAIAGAVALAAAALVLLRRRRKLPRGR